MTRKQIRAAPPPSACHLLPWPRLSPIHADPRWDEEDAYRTGALDYRRGRAYGAGMWGPERLRLAYAFGWMAERSEAMERIP